MSTKNAMRGRFTPTIVRGAPLNMPTAEEIEADPEAALSRLPSWEDLPHDDGEPMETPWHRQQMNLLIETLEEHWSDRDDVFIGGNMFVYFSEKQEFNKDFRGPDFFLVNGGVEKDNGRLSWISWKENGRLPDLIIELVSKTTAKIDRGEKLELYMKQFAVQECFCYDPDGEKLQGWRRTIGGKYVEIEETADGRMWCDQTQLWLTRWTGRHARREATWLRFATKDGSLLPTGTEKAQSAEAEVAKLKHELAALKKKKK